MFGTINFTIKLQFINCHERNYSINFSIKSFNYVRKIGRAPKIKRGIVKDMRKRDVMQINSILSRGMNEPTYDYTARLYYLLFLLWQRAELS